MLNNKAVSTILTGINELDRGDIDRTINNIYERIFRGEQCDANEIYDELVGLEVINNNNKYLELIDKFINIANELDAYSLKEKLEYDELLNILKKIFFNMYDKDILQHMNFKDERHKMEEKILNDTYSFFNDAVTNRTFESDKETFIIQAQNVLDQLKNEIDKADTISDPSIRVSKLNRTAPVTSISKNLLFSNLALPDPETGEYERWENRSNTDEKPIEFLKRVWHEHLVTNNNRKGEVLTQLALRGQEPTKKNPNPKSSGLDRALFFALSRHCKKQGESLSAYVPSKMEMIRNVVSTLDEKEIYRFQSAIYRNKKRMAQNL